MTRVSGVANSTKEAQKMETAKVDIRKLQLLNDRINQCIDALNQVRLSVHGLAATPGLPQSTGVFPGVAGFGLSHTGAPGSPFSQPGFGGNVGPGINPGFGPMPFGQIPTVNPYSLGNPYFSQINPGLSHSA